MKSNFSKFHKACEELKYMSTVSAKLKHHFQIRSPELIKQK